MVWDSSKEPGQRVISIDVEVPSRSSGRHTESLLPESPTVYEEVRREQGGKKYIIMTRKYMSEGHDGFECFAGQKYIIDETSGQTMSAIVRKYLLGKCNEL